MSERSPPPPIFLTTREVAELLRLKERRVYELAAKGAVPCTRATGKLLFPRDELLRWLQGSQSAPQPAFGPAPTDLLVGSHDPLLEWAVRASESGLLTLFDGSLDGLARVARGEATAAGVHLSEGGDRWNVEHVERAAEARPLVLLHWARRERGLLLAPGNPQRIRSLADLAGRRVLPRQAGSGAQLLFEAMLREAGIAPDAPVFAGRPARSESELAEAVATGEVDCAFGLAACARSFRLAFVPLVRECFDLVVDRRAFFDAPFQKLVAFTRSETFAAKAEALGGYDTGAMWQVRWLGR